MPEFPAGVPSLTTADLRIPRSPRPGTRPSPGLAPPRPPRAQPAPPRPAPGSASSAAFKLYKVPLSHLGVSVSPLELGTHRCPQLRVPGKVRSETPQEHTCEAGNTGNPEGETSGPKDHLEGSAGTPASEL